MKIELKGRSIILTAENEDDKKQIIGFGDHARKHGLFSSTHWEEGHGVGLPIWSCPLDLV
jgi:hypothetical protein